MKKYLKPALAVLLALALCIGLSACGGDDIVGTWNVITLSSQEGTANFAEMGGRMTMEFKKGGAGVTKLNMDGSEEISEFTWSISGKSLTITDDGDSFSSEYKINGKTLTMSYVIDGVSIRLTATKQ